jgi:hypothetical protein
VSVERAERIRVALLHHSGAPPTGTEVALQEAGAAPELMAGSSPLDRLLRRRGFTGALTHVPFALGALLRGSYDVAHAFTAVDAQAALRWRRLSGGVVVFGCTEVLDRGNVADRRLRVRFLTDAVKETDAVVAYSDQAREALWRWLAVEAELLEPDDGPAHVALYRRLLAQT